MWKKGSSNNRYRWKKKVEAWAFCTKVEQPTILFIFFSMASKLWTNGFFGDRSIVFWSSYWMWDDDPFFFCFVHVVYVCVLCSVLFFLARWFCFSLIFVVCILYIFMFHVELNKPMSSRNCIEKKKTNESHWSSRSFVWIFFCCFFLSNIYPHENIVCLFHLELKKK